MSSERYLFLIKGSLVMAQPLAAQFAHFYPACFAGQLAGLAQGAAGAHGIQQGEAAHPCARGQQGPETHHRNIPPQVRQSYRTGR